MKQRDAKIATLGSLLATEKKDRSVEGEKMKSEFEQREERYENEILKLKKELRDIQVRSSYFGRYLILYNTFVVNFALIHTTVCLLSVHMRST